MHTRRPHAPLHAAIAALALLLALAASAAPALAADGVTHGADYSDGPDNRYLMGGDWLFRLDREGVGLAQGFQKQETTDGWTTTTVPNAWNAGDNSPESMTGTVGWYRKEFRLPDSAGRLAWILRFESVNYRTKVWVNGKPIGRNTGAYLPFEMRIPSRALKRKGINRLVVRVDNRRRADDFPPSGLSGSGDPTGGWWNYGGLLREVYLKRVDTVNISTVLVRPTLPCAKCAASILARVTVRNFARRATRVSISGSVAGRGLGLGTKTVGAGRFGVFQSRITLRHPRLWSPASPHLYRAHFTVRAGGRKVLGYDLHTGVRSIKVVGGRLFLNGKAVHLRGVGLHEDDPRMGFAIDSARRKQIVAQAKEVGATVIRAHYPLHPEIHELADRLGLLIWSEIPVYALKTSQLKRLAVRKLAAREVEANILANRNHPSVLLWSIGNELSSKPGPVQNFYIRRATRRAKSLDPTRPVALAINGYPAAGCRPQYGPLDILGINSYFGWYPGPNGQVADRDLLSGYLDQVRKCYPHKAIVVTEFGAEANGANRSTSPGGYAFQAHLLDLHLATYAQIPNLAGALIWNLRDFAVAPSFAGGSIRSQVPQIKIIKGINQKGLYDLRSRAKPAVKIVAARFAAEAAADGG